MWFHTAISPLLRYGFLQRALVAGVFISVACAVLGVFLVLRRESMMGHGLAHAAFAGVAVGLFLDVLPLYTALGFAVLTALVIRKIRDKAGLYGDAGIAIFSSVGFAAGVIIASFAHGFNVDLFAFLFGEILAISPAEVVLAVVLAAAVVLVILGNYRSLVYMTFDRESAQAAGVRAGRLDFVLTVLTAVTVVLGMKVVGIILVSALIVIPAATGLQAASRFRSAVVVAAVCAVLSVSAGLAAAFHFDIPASGAVVMTAFLLFAGVTAAARLRRGGGV